MDSGSSPSAASNPTTSPDPAPQPLEYGRNPGVNRRRIIRIAVLLLLCTAAGELLIKYGPTIWRASCLYYYEHECLSHPIPPGVQVYSFRQPQMAFHSPATTGLLAQIIDAWRSRMPMSSKFVPVYVGSRTANDGTTRHIVLCAVASLAPGRISSLYFFAFQLPGSFSLKGGIPLMRFIGGSGDALIRSSYTPTKAKFDIVIYSAVEDPNDPSRFTFTFDWNADHYVENCQLSPNGIIDVQENVYRWNTTQSGERTSLADPQHPTSSKYYIWHTHQSLGHP
jgi:hypothetical protein